MVKMWVHLENVGIVCLGLENCGYRLPWPWKTWVLFELNMWYPHFHDTGIPASKCGSLERDCFQQTNGKKLFISKYI